MFLRNPVGEEVCAVHNRDVIRGADTACENGSMSPPTTQARRRYRGITADERRELRRERLMEAGLELFASDGYANTSIRAVSAAASLNSRYFYESFSSREDLLYHVYLRILTEISTLAATAVARANTIEDKARAGLNAGWTILTEDPRKARIVALEVVGVSPRLEQLRRDMRHALAELTLGQAMMFAEEGVEFRLDPRLTARSLMGGVVEVLVDWINGDVTANVDELVEHFTRLFTAATYAAVRDPAAPRATPGAPAARKGKR
jgi:AcrR family transcriptional regulator